MPLPIPSAHEFGATPRSSYEPWLAAGRYRITLLVDCRLCNSRQSGRCHQHLMHCARESLRECRTVVANAPTGATICLAPGTYPINQPIVPNAGQTIQGGGRATLLGSQRLTDFVPTAHDRWVTDFAGSFGSRTGECLEGAACEFPNAVFSNGQPLRRVTSIVKLTEGAFYCRGHFIYVYGDPSQQQIKVAVAPVAITWNAGDTDPNVTVTGLTIEMFATPAQHGAIDTSAPGWTIEDDRVELNHGAGVTTEGHATIENVDASDNGEEGIGGTGADTMVVDNVIDDNNWAGFDPGWEAGGAKWGATWCVITRVPDYGAMFRAPT
jgi:hypothetical protein